MKKLLLMTSLIGLTACGTELQTEPGTPAPAAAPAQETPAPEAQDIWTTISPGGETACTDGSQFDFMVHQGDPEKVLVYLEGGGGCWTKASCDPNGQPTAKLNLDGQEDPTSGIFDFGNPRNPFSDYSVVYVPYCSGDVHLGANDVSYPGTDPDEPALDVKHRGKINVQSALDWTYDNIAAPQDIFVTGGSAGAIPPAFYAAKLAEQYPEARIAALGDGAGGYRRKAIMYDRVEDWGVFKGLDSVKGFEDLSKDEWSYEQLFIQAGQAFPDMALARFDFAFDPAQSRFLGTASVYDTLLENILANNADIRDAVPDFRAYIAPGTEHTILQKDGFYAITVDEVGLAEWVGDFAAHQPVADITCTDCE